jgi:anti-sigma B factor antagonist
MSAGQRRMNLAITTRSNGVATVIDVAGAVTLENAPEFLKGLMDVVKEKKPPRAVVNLTNLISIDSAGVACLVEVLKISRELKIGFALFGVNCIGRELLEMTHLTHLLEVYETEEEAVRSEQQASSDAAV